MKKPQKKVRDFDLKAFEKQLWAFRKEHNERLADLTKLIKMTNGLFKTYLRKAEKKNDPDISTNIALLFGFTRNIYENVRAVESMMGQMNMRLLEVEATTQINESVMETLKEASLDNTETLYKHLPKRLEELRNHVVQVAGLSQQVYAKTAREKRNFDRQLREVMPAIDWYRELQNHAPKTTRE